MGSVGGSGLELGCADLRGHVVVKDEREVSREQVLVLDALELMERHHHASVAELTIRADREGGVEHVHRRAPEVGI